MNRSNNLDVRIQYHHPDSDFAAVFMRDGQEWYIDGALVGMGETRGQAVDNLMGIAAYLVAHGHNFLCPEGIELDDRLWLFDHLDRGDPFHNFGDADEPLVLDTLYVALRRAFIEAGRTWPTAMRT